MRGKFRRQRERLEFGHHALDGDGLLAFFLQTGQCGGEDIRRRLAETPLALAMEVNRRGEKGQQQGRRLNRAGLVPVIIVGHLGKLEFAVGEALPEKIRLDVGSQHLGLRQQFARRGLIETQQHVRRLDLGALARRRFDLQAAVVIGKDGGGFEGAVFFEEEMHAGIISRNIQ